jgi:hypothetical protein
MYLLPRGINTEGWQEEAFSELRGDKDSIKTTAKNSGCPSHILTPPRRKIRLIEGNKMSSSKKLTCKGQVFICLRLRTPFPKSRPSPLRTVYVYTIQYTYSYREEGERGELNQREG